MRGVIHATMLQQSIRFDLRKPLNVTNNGARYVQELGLSKYWYEDSRRVNIMVTMVIMKILLR